MVAMAPAGGAGVAGAAAPQQIWLHYDYMVAPGGPSYAPDPKGIALVVQAFAAHGIDLHIDPEHTAIPVQHERVAFDIPSTGTGLPAGCVAGDDVVDFSTLRSEYFHPISNHEWHYAIFANDMCGGFSGAAQLPGDNFVVSVPPASDLGDLAPFVDGGAFMHELGHNLGLRHGGDTDVNYKPNYLSVMNYWFDPGGIPVAKAPGSIEQVGYRLDYSEQKLPTLDENHLDERQGIGATGSTDISMYCDPTGWPACLAAPASGPVDWNHNGVIEPDIRDDLDFGNCTLCGYEQITGFDDWAEVHAYLAGQASPGPRTVAIEPPSDQPLITSVSPATGPSTGGTTVTITGVHLKNVSAVSFGPCPAASFAVINEHTVTATSPRCLGANQPPARSFMSDAPVDVSVAAGTSLSPTSADDLFTYHWPLPVVTSVSPGSFFNSGGARITITGYNFTGTTEIDFGSHCWPGWYSQPHYTVVDDSMIVIDPTVPAPCEDVGVFGFKVQNGYGWEAGGSFVNCCNLSDPPSPPPTITSITPAGGPEAGGTLVVVRGSGFRSYWPTSLFCEFPHDWIGVLFGSSTSGCDFGFGLEQLLDDDTLLVTAPPGTGTVDVTATTAGGTTTLSAADQFSYGAAVTAPPHPQITGVSPLSGDRGTPVTLTGTDLAPGPGLPTVDFAGCRPVPARPNPDGTVTVTVPGCATSGQVTLYLSNENGFAAMPVADIGNFTVTGSQPEALITAFTPTSGPPGTAVTITGQNIGYLTGVSFGCGFAEPTANTDGSLTAIVPSCAISGPILVNGTALSQPVSSAGAFTVTS